METPNFIFSNTRKPYLSKGDYETLEFRQRGYILFSMKNPTKNDADKFIGLTSSDEGFLR